MNFLGKDVIAKPAWKIENPVESERSRNENGLTHALNSVRKNTGLYKTPDRHAY